MILSSSTPTHPTPLFATFLYNNDQSTPKDTIQIQRHKNNNHSNVKHNTCHDNVYVNE